MFIINVCCSGGSHGATRQEVDVASVLEEESYDKVGIHTPPLHVTTLREYIVLIKGGEETVANVHSESYCHTYNHQK